LTHLSATLTASNERLKSLETEVARLRSDAGEVEETKKIWASWRRDIEEALESVEFSSDSSSPSSHMPQEVSGIVRRIEQGKRILLQKEDLLLQERGKAKKLQRDLGLIESQLSEKDQELRANKIESSKIEKELNTTKTELRQVKMENNSLTGLMSTYESREGDNKAPTGEVNSAEGPTVQALRTQIKTVEDRNKSITSELEEEREKLGSVTDKFYKLKKEMERQRDLKEKAEERADKAEIMMGKGAYNSEKTRILHLSKNPLQEAIAKKYKTMLEELEGEKERLEAEIATMRSSSRASTPLPTPSKTPSKVSKSSIDYEKMNQRLKMGFQKQTALYREAVYKLTGYKVDIVPNTGNIKLRSMYAEKEGDHLLFTNTSTSSDNTCYELLETEFAKWCQKNDPESIHYLTGMKSTPAFLSNITLSLFSQQTFLG
jgi:mitotic spindle assembly checkpoint protein MAD1